MRCVLPFRASALGCLLLVGTVGFGQKKADCDVKAPTDSSCAAPHARTAVPPPSTASQFTYPGDNSGKAVPNNPASKQFPFPGHAATSGSSAAAGSSSSSSSSSNATSAAGSSADVDPDDPLAPATATTQPTGRRKLPKVKDLQNSDDREAEDVKVAGFYRDQGNNLAAYNRLKDAVKLVSDDADAWYLLGEVAAKMDKPEESAVAYRRFLVLESGTRRAKALEKIRPELRAAR